MHKIGRTITTWAIVIAASAVASAKAQEHDAILNACLVPAMNGDALENKRESCSAVIERQGEVAAKLVTAYGARGWIALRKGEFPNAIADFSSALAMNENFDWALAGRATAFLNSDQSDRALADYDRVIALHPTDARLLVGRGDAHNNLKDYTQGIVDFDHALALDPRNDEAMNDRAWALVRQGKACRGD
jgi:tetratricopeptide (TPR) repeat protein